MNDCRMQIWKQMRNLYRLSMAIHFFSTPSPVSGMHEKSNFCPSPILGMHEKDLEHIRKEMEPNENVHIITVREAQGLEFDTVVLAGFDKESYFEQYKKVPEHLQSEKRKILMVISDGAPIDDSTLAVNDSDILSDHLHHVVKKIEKLGKVEIVSVGIGHDTKNFYRNSVMIKNLEELEIK